MILDEGSISIVGAGYVGLSTAVAFATKGKKVVAVDLNPEKVALINSGTPPFHEPSIEDGLKKSINEGYLKCVLDPEKAILNTNITFITVGTPNKPDGSINLQYIKDSARTIGQVIRKKKSYHLVVVKSTVVPGTTKTIIKPTLEKHAGKLIGTEFGVCVNPEFLREGSAVYDMLNPDRIIIGDDDQKSGDVLEAFYRDFYSEGMPPIIRTNLSTAELIKYANNAFLATKISFVNQIANICERIPDADITKVAEGIGADRRISHLFLNAGLGYGGSCLSKDVEALISFSNRLDYDPKLLTSVKEVNNIQPFKAVELACEVLGRLKGRRIAILGLAFKPNTDDMREAVSKKIINKLLEEGANVIAYDPEATSKAKYIYKNRIEYATSAINCISGTECCIIVTEWNEFKKITPEDFIQQMNRPFVIDGRRIYDPKQYCEKLEFKAIGLGETGVL